MVYPSWSSLKHCSVPIHKTWQRSVSQLKTSCWRHKLFWRWLSRSILENNNQPSRRGNNKQPTTLVRQLKWTPWKVIHLNHWLTIVNHCLTLNVLRLCKAWYSGNTTVAYCLYSSNIGTFWKNTTLNTICCYPFTWSDASLNDLRPSSTARTTQPSTQGEPPTVDAMICNVFHGFPSFCYFKTCQCMWGGQ